MVEGCIPKAFGAPKTGVDLQVIAAARSALIPTSLHSGSIPTAVGATVGAVGRKSTLRGAPRHELKQVLNVPVRGRESHVRLPLHRGEGGRCVI